MRQAILDPPKLSAGRRVAIRYARLDFHMKNPEGASREVVRLYWWAAGLAVILLLLLFLFTQHFNIPLGTS